VFDVFASLSFFHTKGNHGAAGNVSLSRASINSNLRRNAQTKKAATKIRDRQQK